MEMITYIVVPIHTTNGIGGSFKLVMALVIALTVAVVCIWLVSFVRDGVRHKYWHPTKDKDVYSLLSKESSICAMISILMAVFIGALFILIYKIL